MFDMEEQFITDDGEKYKVVSFAEDNNKFMSKNDKDSRFVYGQRHSNFLINQNIMILMQDGSIAFMIIEGRGFDSMGVQRSYVMNKLKNIKGIRSAVSLDGGFSAQAVIYDKSNEQQPLRFLVSDPERRELGLSLQFIKN